MTKVDTAHSVVNCHDVGAGRLLPEVGVVGMFPPPLNGMSAVTVAIVCMLRQRARLHIIDCSPGVYNLRSIWVRIRKMVCMLSNITVFLRWAVSHKTAPLYLAVSAGWGQLYDIAFVACARFSSRPIYLHHHGYRYIDRYSLIAATLFYLSGKRSMHIVACDVMAADLKSRYSSVRNTWRLSGVICLPEWSAPPYRRQYLSRIGFLSNISREKGIYEFLMLAERCRSLFPRVRFVVAGQFQDQESRAYVNDSVGRLSNLEYIGPVYDDDKLAFLDRIDLLVFPTHTESEGLVIHEAHSRGIPVIARSRGCIPTIIGPMLALECNDLTEFVDAALSLIGEWVSDPRSYSQLAGELFSRFESQLRVARDSAERLVDEIAA